MTDTLTRADLWLRATVPAATILLVCLLVEVAGRLEPSPMTPVALLVIVVQAYVVAELGRLTTRHAAKRLAERTGTPVRVSVQLVTSALVAVGYVLAIYLPIKAWLIAQGENDAIGFAHLALVGIAALAVSIVSGLLHFSLQFLTGWRDAEQDRLRLRLENLRSQLEPHFLFNSLNALYATIAEDPGRAQAMVLKLSALFRHALEHHDRPLVTLAEELEVVAAYAELLRARHGDGVRVRVDADPESRRKGLPPLALQVLVENAAKHNRVGGRGLDIEIVARENAVRVSNRVEPRGTAVAGAGVGLANLARRYELLRARPPVVTSDTREFAVDLALLELP